MAKIVYEKSTHNGRQTIWEGTIEYLRTKVFGYTLECGHGWNKKIPKEPKTLKSLVNALNNSAEETRRYSDYYEASTKEEFDNAENKNHMEKEI